MKKTFLLLTASCCIFFAYSQSWSLTGNAGTNASTNFIGTTDATPLIFRVNNELSGKIEITNHLTFFGFHAGFANTNGADNAAFGSYSLVNNATGIRNTAMGSQSMFSNTDGSGNVAIGTYSLNANTIGYGNVAIGALALVSNTTGNRNVAVGEYTQYGTTTGYDNAAIGYNALTTNLGGSINSALGSFALAANVSGSSNSAVGSYALQLNLNSYNTGIGYGALQNTKNAQYNTALGYASGGNYDNGYNNVYLGANTAPNKAGLYNVIAIGQATVATLSSQVTIGNGATSYYRMYTNSWQNISDGRFKKNIKEGDVPGLDFIVRLRPVTYNLDATGLDAFLHKNIKDSTSADGKAIHNKALKEKEQQLQMGFVAQEMEKTAKELNLKISSVVPPANADDVYGIRYGELVVPLVKAIQEQQKMIDSLRKDISSLKEQADITVLLRETLAMDKISAYPNPVANDMTVTIVTQNSGKGLLQVFDSGKRLVKETSVNVTTGVNTMKLALPVLGAGYYTLKISWGKDMHREIGFIKSN